MDCQKGENMKTIKITTDNKLSIIDMDFDDYRDIQKAGGIDETAVIGYIWSFEGGIR